MSTSTDTVGSTAAAAATHSLQRDLKIWCNFVNIQNKDFLRNAIDDITSDKKPQKGTSIGDLNCKLRIEENGFFGRRPCLVATRYDDIDHIYQLGGGVDGAMQFFSFAFWFLIRPPPSHRPGYHSECRMNLQFQNELEIHLVDFKMVSNSITVEHHRKVKSTPEFIHRHPTFSSEINRWQHIAIIYSKDEYKYVVYLNGEKKHEIHSQEDTAKTYGGCKTIAFGISWENGSLADIGVWFRELQPIEISSIYQQETTIDKVVNEAEEVGVVSRKSRDMI